MIYKRKEYFDYLASRGIKESTMRYVEFYLEQFHEWLRGQPVKYTHEVTPKIMDEYQYYLMNDYKPKRVKKLSVFAVIHSLQTVKKYFGYLVKNKFIFLDPTIEMELPEKPIQIPKGILTPAEVESLINAPDNTPVGVRDKAMLELMYSSALRRGELCDLDLYDANLKDMVIHVRISKTNRARLVPMGTKAKEAIEQYLLSSRPIMARHPGENALFISQYGTRITKGCVNYIVKAYSKKVKLEKKISPHGLRHSCATHLLQNGADIIHIQRILGHARLKTTQIYTRVINPDLKKAHEKAHPRKPHGKNDQP